MQLIMNLCDRVQVLARGKTISKGSPTEVQTDAAVREAYLGATDQTGVRVRERAQAAVAQDVAPLLRIEGLVVDYGPVRALSNVSMTVGRGEFVAVIGPNGAGKSTLLSAIAGPVSYTHLDVYKRQVSGKVAQRTCMKRYSASKHKRGEQ